MACMVSKNPRSNITAGWIGSELFTMKSQRTVVVEFSHCLTFGLSPLEGINTMNQIVLRAYVPDDILDPCFAAGLPRGTKAMAVQLAEEGRKVDKILARRQERLRTLKQHNAGINGAGHSQSALPGRSDLFGLPE